MEHATLINAEVLAGKKAHRERRPLVAVEHYERAISLCEEIGFTESLRFVYVVRLLGDCCRECEFYSTALRHAERSLDIVRTLNHGEPPVVMEHARCDQSLAAVFSHLGRTTEAIASYASALLLYERCGDEEGTIVTLGNLGAQYRHTGQFDEGLAVLQRAESMCTGTPGGTAKYAAQLIKILTAKGNILCSLGRTEEALDCDLDALKRKERRYGPHSVEAAVCLTNIGSVYFDRGDFTGAVDSYHRALAIYEGHGLQDSADFATLTMNLGSARMKLGDEDEALDHYERCLAIRRRLLPPDHPQIAGVLRNISAVNARLGRTAAATDAFAASTAVARRSQTACAGPGCARKLREDGAALDVCNNCRRTFYCGLACQKADWKAGHKAECRKLISEAVALAAALAAAPAVGAARIVTSR